MVRSSFVFVSSVLLGAVAVIAVFAGGAKMDAQQAPLVSDGGVTQSQSKDVATAIFAGGCFWCVESDFDKVSGVVSTVSGYTGGTTSNPTYKSVTYEDTGHYEAVKVSYDPTMVSYSELVEYFFRHVDPTDAGGQFCDRGASYRTAIFAQEGDQITTAKTIKTQLDKASDLPAPIITPVLPASAFWDAEGYHQDYYLTNPVRYKYYRYSCGRDARVKAVWKNAPEPKYSITQ